MNSTIWKREPITGRIVPKKPHLVECPDCGGAGEVLGEGFHGNDPGAPVFSCEQCGGGGRVRCADDGCCDYEPPEDAHV